MEGLNFEKSAVPRLGELQHTLEPLSKLIQFKNLNTVNSNAI